MSKPKTRISVLHKKRLAVHKKHLADSEGLVHLCWSSNYYKGNNAVTLCNAFVWLSKRRRDEFHREREQVQYSRYPLLGDTTTTARPTAAGVSCVTCLTYEARR